MGAQELLIFLVVALLLFFGLRQFFREKERKRSGSSAAPALARSEKNPALAPARDTFWESEAVFNPAVFYDGEQVHLFYRAVGGDGVSRLGYATSTDGVHFTRRSDFPAYELSKRYHPPAEKRLPQNYNPNLYASGGSWGGIEDPRIVKLEDDIYMTFTAFMGWDAVRIALTSLSHVDCLNLQWRWRKPSFISPPGQVHKNWVLFPEKVRGKYAVLHSISPAISIHYVDSLEDLFDENTHLESIYEREERKGAWDTWMRGAGAPPVKTDDGWLLFYHAISADEQHKYKVGAMLLDFENPENVVCRSKEPILCPDMEYENDGKPGVVYVTGAATVGDTLFVYYGGGDKTVNVASAPLGEFLNALKEHEEPKLKTQSAII